MPKPVDDSLSDGLEIMSIGTLYVGRWDRKYWSSSRGKDRYPYPIGYQALQTRNGLTYMMEVLEGAKGPTFQITSNDKQSASGETPDIAWGNFMKKGCSRLKHWPGKRFSGKVDGVELFGFKNALVQRLLRELVASVNHASDNSSHSNNMGKASAKGQDVGHPVKYQSPDLISSSDQTKVTSKRKRTRNDIDTTSGCKRREKIFQLLNEDDIGKDPCIRRMISNVEPVTSSTFSVFKINQADEPLLLLPDMELRKNVPLPDKDLPVKSIGVLDDLKAESSLADVQSKLASTKKSSAASFADVELLLENNLPDRQCTRTLGQGLSVVTKEKNGKAQATPDDELNSMSPVLTGILSNCSADIRAPDSLDTKQGSGNCIQQNATSRTELVADIVISEEPISGSHSDDQTCYVTGCPGKSGLDTVGEDIANPMQSALLPRAIPFLKYSLKRKKKKASSSKQLSCGLKYDEKLVASTHDKSDAEGVKRTNHANLVESIIESGKYIVPDSLDDDQSEYFVGNKLPSPFKNAEKVSVDAQENKMFNHKVLPKDCDTRVQKDSVLASHSYQTFIPPNHIVEGVDHWSTAEANFNFILHSSKKTDEENISDGKGMFSQDSAGVQKYPLHVNIPPKKEEYSSPLSESIICRNEASHVLEMDHEAETLVSSDFSQSRGIVDSYLSKTSFGVQGKLERQISYLKGQNAFGQNNTLSIVQAQENAMNCALMIDSGIDRVDIRVRNSQQYHRKNEIGAQHGESVYQSSDPRDGGCQNCTFGIEEDIANTGISCPAKQRSRDIEENMKLIGCYSHLLQISSVKLADIGDEIYICVSCGPTPPEDGKRDLFLYKLSSKEPSLGRPCVVGHTSIRLPSLKDEFGRDVAMDKSALQFTPDARGLVLVDSIRLPYCRENNLHCSCPQCESCCFEENAVKIVQIQHGYASLILKLHTIYAVHCILVCEPQCLIAVDESGRIYIWIMDPTWSIQMEQYIILSHDFLSSRIIELKRVPKSFSMVIGHNGYGQFSLWDIAKRTVVAEFSAPANSILEYLPVSLFWCQTKSMSGGKFVVEECAKKLVEETTLWFSGQNEVNMSCLTDEKDVALWVLMYTSSDSTVTSVSSSYSSNSDGCWRLCLLVKNTVIMGSAFPSSTASIGTSSGIGIIGTYKGCVDIWELATGNQLGSLHHHAGKLSWMEIEGSGYGSYISPTQERFGKQVSHVAVDDSSSSIVAVAHDDGQLFVYLRH